MYPELSLLILGLIAEFLLRTTLGFGICLLLDRLVSHASYRFCIWAGFVFASAAYWAYLACTLIPFRRLAVLQATAPSQSSPVAAHFATSPWLALRSVPQTWGFYLVLALSALGLVYGLAILWAVISHGNKLRRLRWVMSFATEPPADVAESFRLLAKHLGIRPPRLRVLSGAFSPATFGWLRPVVMLPTVCVEEENADLEDILLHELHHVRRRDAFWDALTTAARTLICFHPAAWYAMRRMRVDRELACDLAVISRSPARKRMYAESLLRFARLNVAPEPAGWGIDFAAPSDHLTVRIHSILSEARRSARWLLWLRTATGVALLAAFAGVVPSLAVLLEYTHPATQALPASVELATPVSQRKLPRVSRRVRTQASSESIPNVPLSSTLEAAAPVAEAAGEHADLSDGPGPHLQRRGATPAPARSLSIPLIDDNDSGQSGKHGDASQAVQQSATVAAAIWKRVGDLDRH